MFQLIWWCSGYGSQKNNDTVNYDNDVGFGYDEDNYTNKLSYYIDTTIIWHEMIEWIKFRLFLLFVVCLLVYLKVGEFFTSFWNENILDYDFLLLFDKLFDNILE